jgi:ParB family transcriptional regulator, chromosome partitioning protein
MPRSALGRGLGALLGGTPTTTKPAATADATTVNAPMPSVDPRERVERIPLSRIQPSALQPRKDFPAEALRELADSIKEQGIIQPLIVRSRGNNFELIAGERRWRASQILGLSEVPVIVRDSDDRTVLELMLIENLQRENLNAIEEAQGYEELIEKFHLTQEEVAVKVGKSRTAVANAMRLLKLAPDIQTYVRDGRLSVGHAKVILGLNSNEEQTMAAHRIVKAGLSVRQTEELVSHLQNRQMAGPRDRAGSVKGALMRDAHVADLESKLQERFGTKVSLRYRQGKGALEVKFFNDDDLERILQIMGLDLE